MALTTEQVALWKRNAVMSGGRTSSIALKIMLARIIALADEVLACREAQPVAWSFPGSETESRQLGYDDELDSEQKRNCIPLYTAPPAPAVPGGLKRAVTFYEQVKRENPPVETGAWKDAVNWVLEEARRAAMLGGEK